jgi:translation initiation factor IF-3
MNKKPFPPRPGGGFQGGPKPQGQKPFQRPFRGPGKKEDLHRINEKITAPEVRVVGEGIEPAVYPIRKALEIAELQGLDLVEIAPQAEPPVCKVIDYKKFLYELKKKQKEIKSKAAKVIVKEIRFGPQTDDHDYNFKKNHAIKFLQDGNKVKAYVMFKGRSIVFKDQGEILLLRFVNELEQYGKAESLPQLEGKRMIIIIAPKKK